ncbi:MAG: hypothetical protein HOQ05_06470 [Corynebacteriales bacterium]|nr:hypothetical protein [Mycobacteriales bacterium]
MGIEYLSGLEELERFPEGECVYVGLKQPVEELEPRRIRGFFRGGPYEDPLNEPHVHVSDTEDEFRHAVSRAENQKRIASKAVISPVEAMDLEVLTMAKLEPHPLVHAAGSFMYAAAYGFFHRPEEGTDTFNAGGKFDPRTEEACMKFALRDHYRAYLGRLGSDGDAREAWVHIMGASRFQASLVAGEWVSKNPEKPDAIVRIHLGELRPHWSSLPRARRLGAVGHEAHSEHSGCWHVPLSYDDWIKARENWQNFGAPVPTRPRM